MQNGFRDNTIEFLRALQDLDPMIGPVELCCGWFDDLYHPGSDMWEGAFSPDEKLALGEFNATFAAVSSDLSQDFQQFQQDTRWQTVSFAARTALGRP
jgi:hypothetical protein